MNTVFATSQRNSASLSMLAFQLQLVSSYRHSSGFDETCMTATAAAQLWFTHRAPTGWRRNTLCAANPYRVGITWRYAKEMSISRATRASVKAITPRASSATPRDPTAWLEPGMPFFASSATGT